ncbi:TonB-dependent receptor [Hymenobacter sp. BT635]|uniref:TonB-dependent receptor n=1 Tax=Hymenobacter nitidus TaxID=2880929 RepID=A0ABS8A916_9BACT|nr:TonB-dependent receptor [Hymenobacter nitidus]MCB2376227.1 TonB-dependent receptor [Hymenobacter nitidus]
MIVFYGLRPLRLPFLRWRPALLVAAAAWPAATHAQQPAPDSASQLTRMQQLPAVRVQGTKPGRFAVGSHVTTIDSVALAQYRNGTVADILSARTPIYIKNYGPGQLASISIRGTSARHTAVLWNGLNISLPSLGESDFALFPTSGATQVQVQHGPASALYGSSAIGGTVLLSSPARWAAGPQVSVQTDVGSFGLVANSLEGSFSNEKLAVRTAASHRAADNDFPYEVREATGMVRRRQENAALRQWSLAQDIMLRTGQHSEWLAAAWLTDADRQIQPSTGSANSQATQHDQSRRLLAGYRHVAARHESGVRVAWFEDVLNYRSDAVTSNSRVRTTQAQAEHTFTFRPTMSLRLGAEAQHFSGLVDGYKEPINENRYAGFALLRYDPRPTLHLTANFRQAVLPGRRAPLAPTLGAEWQFWQTEAQTFSAKATASRSYRAPTLNERFWPTGDPNLAPESGVGYEAGLTHAWHPATDLTLKTELTAYHQLVDDWVQWLPDRQGRYTPKNLRQVRAQGLEFSSRLEWQHQRYRLQARTEYAYTQSRKVRGYLDDPDPLGQQLAYVPLHAASFSTDQHWRHWQLSTVLTYTGMRFIDATASNQLPGYTLLNATVGRTLQVAPTWSVTVLAQGFNLTNLIYQSYEYRAMPRRSGSVSVRLNWH